LKRSHPQIRQIFRKRKEPHAKDAKNANIAKRSLFFALFASLAIFA